MAHHDRPAQHSTLPPPLVLYQMSIGHYVSRALHLAAKLRIADELAGGARPPAELATATQTHPAALKRVMRLLASVGVLEEQENGDFALTAIGELLRADVPGSMRAAVMLFAGIGIQDSWKELEYCVRTGEPAFRKTSPDADPFASMSRDPEQAAMFDQAMAATAPMFAAAVAGAYDFSSVTTVVDVGGGNGAILTGILGAHAHLSGIVFDQPASAARATETIAALGLAARCRAIGGDFFAEVPAGGDVYILKHVIHDWNDDKATAILKNCRRAMPRDGKVLIVEGVYPPRIDRSLEGRGAAANDVNMLVCTGGRQRSEAEFVALLERSGFQLARIIPTPARASVIEGTPD